MTMLAPSVDKRLLPFVIFAQIQALLLTRKIAHGLVEEFDPEQVEVAPEI